MVSAVSKPILSSEHNNLQGAVDAAVAQKQPLVIDQPISLTQPVQVTEANNLHIINASEIRATANMDALMDAVGTSWLTIEGGRVTVETGVEVGTLIRVRNDEAITSKRTKAPRLDRIQMTLYGTGSFEMGVQFGSEGDTFMLDEGAISRIGVNGRFGVTQYGIRIVGAWGNGFQHTLSSCYAYYCAIGYSIEQSNSISLRGCNADGGDPDSGGGAIAYYVTSTNCHIADCRVEAYRQLLASNGPSSGLAKMRLTNVDFAAQEMDTENPYVIDWKYAGLLALDGVTIGRPPTKPAIRYSSQNGAKCRISGGVQVYGLDENRPAANELLVGDDWRGDLAYQQGTYDLGFVSDEVIGLVQ